MNADTEVRRLQWRCRRGMKELDLLLERYLKSGYPSAGALRQRAFVHLLTLQDPELHAYLVGGVEAIDAATRDVLRTITRSAP